MSAIVRRVREWWARQPVTEHHRYRECWRGVCVCGYWESMH
jgi:hypothetical protein